LYQLTRVTHLNSTEMLRIATTFNASSQRIQMFLGVGLNILKRPMAPV